MFGTKGQEEGPFALFLAAAMLALLLPIIAQMYTNYDRLQCENKIQSNMQRFASEIEIATGLTGNATMINLNFGDLSCGSVMTKNITIRNPRAEDCIKFCNVGSCRIIVAEGEQDGFASVVGQPVCVRIPMGLTLDTRGCPAPMLDTDRGYRNIEMTSGGERMFGLNLTEPKSYSLVFLKDSTGTANKFRICCYGTLSECT
ncbi:hypothetical protein K8R43_04020 [archaeon]|nr:hypothetical protein [archaeon]